jgi:hypothetical protein
VPAQRSHRQGGQDFDLTEINVRIWFENNFGIDNGMRSGAATNQRAEASPLCRHWG